MDASNLTSRWQQLSFESEALKGNPLGDPHVRPVYVWTPTGDGSYPTIYVLQGFTGMGPAWFNVRPFEQSFPEVVDALAPEAIVVLVDAFTAIGGSQFLDSPAIGNYHTYLCDELVPWVDTQFPTSDQRGVQGKSSGGYGAMVTAMLRPDLFSAFATHAGDAIFDRTYRANRRGRAIVAQLTVTSGSGKTRSGGLCFGEDRPLLDVGDVRRVFGRRAAADPRPASDRGCPAALARMGSGRDGLRAEVCEALRQMRAIWIDAAEAMSSRRRCRCVPA